MKSSVLGGIGFFLLVTLCFVVLGVNIVAQDYLRLPVEEGVLDASDVNFEKDAVAISPDQFIHYPEQLLHAGEEGIAGGEEIVSFGTYRLRLLLPQDRVYATSQTANDMAYIVMVDEQIVGRWGIVGDTRETSQARAGTLTTTFYPHSGEIELSFQYSGFIRHYRPPSLNIGSVETIVERQHQPLLRDMLFPACYFTAGLLFLGMFLFLGRARKQNHSLYFSLLCFCLMAGKLVTGMMPLAVLVPLSSEAVARIEYLSMLGVMLFCALYANSLFSGVFHKLACYAVAVLIALYALCILLLPPSVFTGMRTVFLGCLWVAALYAVVMLVWRVRKPTVDQLLSLTGVLLFVAVALMEQTVFRWILPYQLGGGFLTSCATVGFIFLNMVALSLAALRAERELEETRLREKTLKEENQMLDRLGAMKTEFFANISHEMKTPLTVMNVNAQMSKAMVEQGVQKERIYASLDVVTDETLRLARMVSDTLELSNLQEGQRTNERLSIAQILLKTAAAYEPLLERRGNKLMVSVPDTLPLVWGNADHLIQVVVNLLSNAAVHTKDGVIELTSEAQELLVRVCISDTGSGVAEELLPRVFERHVRGESGGAGLGLSLCRDIIEQHGGSITLENRPEGGCVVSFTLPAEEDDGSSTSF